VEQGPNVVVFSSRAAQSSRPSRLDEYAVNHCQERGRNLARDPLPAQQVDELIPNNPAARFGRLFNARHDAREHVTVLEPSQAKPLNDAWFRDRVWRPLLEKAEVRHIRVHDARYTYASLMLRRGVPIVYVSRQLGHSSIQVTVDLYGHFVPGADRHHVEGLAEAIEEAVTGRTATLAQPAPTAEQQPTA